MSQTVIRGTQILNNTVQRQDLDTSTVGQAVVTKIVQGSGISLSSTGADSGTGDVTVTSPDVVSTDAGNIATLGTDNHILVPQSQIWSVRLRSFNAIANSNFEADQRNVGNAVVNPAGGTFIIDRWIKTGTGTYTVNCRQIAPGTIPVVPGTNFQISSKIFQVNLQTAQASLGAGDTLGIRQMPEGIQLRELINDVHSVSLLVQSTVAPLSFSVALRDAATTRSLVKLCTISTANVWTLITLPNLPVWPSAGTFNITSGLQGYYLDIVLACGTTNMAPAADTWQTGNFVGAPGMSNFCNNPVNTIFAVAMVQHEPGALCTMPIDCPFTQNYDDCLRYYQKTVDYDVAVGTANAVGSIGLPQASTALVVGPTRFHKPMAKIPTCTAYSDVSGAVNTLRLTGVDYTVSSFMALGKAGFQGINTATMPAVTAGAYGRLHYTADTGW